MTSNKRWQAGVWGLGIAAAAVLAVSLFAVGCSDDVGHTRTTTKRVESTPEGTKTTTYTHEKDTRIIDR